MAWNEPGGNDKNNDPWGNRKDKGPPDLDKFLSDLVKKFGLLLKGKNPTPWQAPVFPQHSYAAILALVALLFVVWLLAGFYIVNPAEEAVVLRLGKFTAIESPGLHWLPRLIDTKTLVDVQKIYSFPLSGDYLTKSSDQGDVPNTYLQVTANKKMVGDLDQSKNLVNIELNVQYRIEDPQAYLYNVINPDETIKEVASGALSDVVGQMKLDDVLTTGREMLSSGVMERIKNVLANYNTGLQVVAVNLRKVQSPDQVRAAFNDVNRADQDKATYIQQAQAYASKVVPLAQGAAARTLADANAYQQKVVLTAKANVAKYQALLKVYNTAPAITRERLYLETMQTIMQNTTKVLIDSGLNNNLLYLPLDKLINNASPNVGDDATTITARSLKITTTGNEEGKE